jgi:hypothetical protein
LCDKVFLDPPKNVVKDPEWVDLGPLSKSVKFYGVVNDIDQLADNTIRATLELPFEAEVGVLYALGSAS